MITEPQIGPTDLQIVAVPIRPTDMLHSTFCRVPLYSNVTIRSRTNDLIGEHDVLTITVMFHRITVNFNIKFKYSKLQSSTTTVKQR